jgi:hypothetical protein
MQKFSKKAKTLKNKRTRNILRNHDFLQKNNKNSKKSQKTVKIAKNHEKMMKTYETFKKYETITKNDKKAQNIPQNAS